MEQIEVRVYITNLGKYNEGELVGEWLDIPASEDEIQAVMDKIGVKYGTDYEEYFITDYETNVSYKIGEYTSIERINSDIEAMIEAEDNAYLWDALADYVGGLQDNLEQLCYEVSHGYYQFMDGISAEEYEMDLVADSYNIELDKLGWLARYIHIDYKQMARDDDSIYETDNGVLIAC